MSFLCWFRLYRVTRVSRSFVFVFRVFHHLLPFLPLFLELSSVSDPFKIRLLSCRLGCRRLWLKAIRPLKRDHLLSLPLFLAKRRFFVFVSFKSILFCATFIRNFTMILPYFLPFNLPWQLSMDCTGTNRGASRRVAFMPALRRFADNLPRTWHIIVLESIMAYFRVTTIQPRSCQNQFTVLYVWKFDRSIDFSPRLWQVTREILPRFFPCRFPFNHPIRYESIKPYYHGGSVEANTWYPNNWINPQAPLMASGETRISWSCKVPAVHYVPASSHPLSLFTYVSFFALISC